MPNPERITAIFNESLVSLSEMEDNNFPDGTVLVDTSAGTTGFNPTRLENNRSEVESMVGELHSSFSGDGNVPMALGKSPSGDDWTADHSVMFQLMCLGLGLEKFEYAAPPSGWKLLPGGVPFIKIR